MGEVLTSTSYRRNSIVVFLCARKSTLCTFEFLLLGIVVTRNTILLLLSCLDITAIWKIVLCRGDYKLQNQITTPCNLKIGRLLKSIIFKWFKGRSMEFLRYFNALSCHSNIIICPLWKYFCINIFHSIFEHLSCILVI